MGRWSLLMPVMRAAWRHRSGAFCAVCTASWGKDHKSDCQCKKCISWTKLVWWVESWMDTRCPLKLFYHSPPQMGRGEKIQQKVQGDSLLWASTHCGMACWRKSAPPWAAGENLLHQGLPQAAGTQPALPWSAGEPLL